MLVYDLSVVNADMCTGISVYEHYAHCSVQLVSYLFKVHHDVRAEIHA